MDGLFKFCVCIHDILMEGTVSQIFLFRPWFLFNVVLKMIFTNFTKCFPFFDINKNEDLTNISDTRFAPNGFQEKANKI